MPKGEKHVDISLKYFSCKSNNKKHFSAQKHSLIYVFSVFSFYINTVHFRATEIKT